MNHAKALLIKGIMTFAVLLLLLGSFASLGDILVITLVLGAISYLAGDLFILPKTSNLTASLSDLALSFFVIWGLGLMLFEQTNGIVFAALFASVLIASGEWLFHSYMADRILRINRKI
ncbi:DUF2512 family protein [Mesobacillus jeotgali]|uniref:DUF2512 family protein n=1 Tax=Mesobacillus jeotgali TaxID=129985 RepID=A0ABY9VH28_9BACI|nr:DUF2512 family protein [Mesobacillus jeotgali]WNF22883.1 DUF2512 family protein [Mesobacillus jeotgali]